MIHLASDAPISSSQDVATDDAPPTSSQNTAPNVPPPSFQDIFPPPHMFKFFT